MDNPKPDSAAAIVKTNKTNTCPMISSKYNEKIIKFKLIERSNNSSDTKAIKIFLLFKTKPNTPIKKINTVIFKK